MLHVRSAERIADPRAPLNVAPDGVALNRAWLCGSEIPQFDFIGQAEVGDKPNAEQEKRINVIIGALVGCRSGEGMERAWPHEGRLVHWCVI